MTRDLFKFVLFLLGLVALALGALRLFFVDVYAISGIGMIPTLTPGEQVFGWRGAVIDQGDIVICEHPTRAGMLVVGRVLAVAGKTVETERGNILVNNRRLERDIRGEFLYTNPITNRSESVAVVAETLDFDQQHLMMEPMRGHGEIRIRKLTVPEGKLYLLGDNRLQTAEDSRSFGPVTASTCRAQLFMRNGAVAGSPGPAHRYFDLLD